MRSTSRIVVNGETYEVEIQELSRNNVTFTLNGRTYRVGHEVAVPTATAGVSKRAAPVTKQLRYGEKTILAPMSGVIIAVDCNPGDVVAQGAVLLRIEAMKMQNNIVASADGCVGKIHVSVGDEIRDGQLLIELE